MRATAYKYKLSKTLTMGHWIEISCNLCKIYVKCDYFVDEALFHLVLCVRIVEIRQYYF